MPLVATAMPPKPPTSTTAPKVPFAEHQVAHLAACLSMVGIDINSFLRAHGKPPISISDVEIVYPPTTEPACPGKAEETPAFPLCSKEFGETFHVAFAMLAETATRVSFDAASLAQQVFFYSIFPGDRIVATSTSTPPLLGLRQSTRLITQTFGPRPDGEALLARLLGKQYGDTKALIRQTYLLTRDTLNIDCDSNKVAIWIRRVGGESAGRDLHPRALLQLVERVAALLPEHELIFFGDAIAADEVAGVLKILDGTRAHWLGAQECPYYQRPEFIRIFGMNTIAGQLSFQFLLTKFFNLRFVIGMMSGALDGLAFLCGNCHTIFFGNTSRMSLAAAGIDNLHAIPFDQPRFAEAQVFSEAELDALESCINSAGVTSMPPPVIDDVKHRAVRIASAVYLNALANLMRERYPKTEIPANIMKYVDPDLLAEDFAPIRRDPAPQAPFFSEAGAAAPAGAGGAAEALDI